MHCTAWQGGRNLPTSAVMSELPLWSRHQTRGGSGGVSHVKLIVFEAHVPEGELAQLTQALQNALRPTTTHQQVKVVAAVGQQQLSNPVEEIGGADEEATKHQVDEVVAPTPLRPAKETKPRRLATPTYIERTSDQVTSWKQFAGARVPKNDTDRYVLAVVWSKDTVAEDGVTSDHVFTCFRDMKWSVDITDFGSLMRSLKASQVFKNVGRGKYIPTQLALQRIDDMDHGGS